VYEKLPRHTTAIPSTYRISELVGVMFFMTSGDNAGFGKFGQAGYFSGKAGLLRGSLGLVRYRSLLV
jgi:hypothetical protein